MQDFYLYYMAASSQHCGIRWRVVLANHITKHSDHREIIKPHPFTSASDSCFFNVTSAGWRRLDTTYPGQTTNLDTHRLWPSHFKPHGSWPLDPISCHTHWYLGQGFIGCWQPVISLCSAAVHVQDTLSPSVFHTWSLIHSLHTAATDLTGAKTKLLLTPRHSHLCVSHFALYYIQNYIKEFDVFVPLYYQAAFYFQILSFLNHFTSIIADQMYSSENVNNFYFTRSFLLM